MTQEELFALIETRIGRVTERERQVLTLRFGLEDGKIRSLEEVAEIMGVTRERVRQIENKVLRRRVHLTRSKKIKDFYT